jgi:hypothetical protein
MNYILEITSADYPIKFGQNNPNVDNLIDKGQFVKPELITDRLQYVDAENVDIPCEELRSLDAFRSVSGGILVSARVKQLIDAHFPNQVQFIPVEFEYKAKIAKDFFVMNVYAKLECYDLDKSEYELSEVDGSYDFSKIILNNAPLEEYGVEYHVIRPVYDIKTIVVSENFKAVMEANQINSLAYATGFEMEW